MKAYWIAVGLVVAVMGVGTSPAGAVEGSFFGDADYRTSGRVDSKSGGVIAAGNREAALAGLKILDAGGNAVDAAAATLFAVGVAQYESCGIGGGGFMVYRSADGQVVDGISRSRGPASRIPTTSSPARTRFARPWHRRPS